nr:DUF58 domain-containing protein [Gammaproteobacteria bacterium]
MATSASPFSKRFAFPKPQAATRSLAEILSKGRLAAWLARGRPSDPPSFVLGRRRIYILPTRFGLAFGGVVLAMLFASINYSASLGFALTFLLVGLGVAMLHHCHANLLGLEVSFAGASPVFAGGEARFRLRLSNPGRVPRYEIALGAEGREFGPVDVPAGESVVIAFGVPATRRGRLEAPRFSIATRHPGALFRAWTYARMDIACIVYPEPAPPGIPRPATRTERGSDTAERGDADFAGLRNALPGDPPRRIAWKAYARTDELLLKEFAGGGDRVDVLDYDEAPGKDPEQRLSVLARWCLDAAAEGMSFGLRLPGQTVPIGSGESHLHRCLEALALFPAASEDRQ